MRALDWRAVALCAGKTGLFFGPANERPRARRTREHNARQVGLVTRADLGDPQGRSHDRRSDNELPPWAASAATAAGSLQRGM